MRILLQITHIDSDPVDLVNVHAPIDATIEGILFVQGKVMTTPGPQQNDDFLQGALILPYDRKLFAVNLQRVVEIIDDLGGEVLCRGNNVGQTGGNGAARHTVKLGCRRLLRQHQPRLSLDCLQTQGPIRIHAGEDDADAFCLPVFGQGAKEKINGETRAARGRRLEEVEQAVQNRHIFVRGDHINAVGIDFHPIRDLKHFHGGSTLEEFSQDPLMVRVEMLNDDKGHAAVRRHRTQKLLQRLQPARRGTEADYRETEAFLPGLSFYRQTRSGDFIG